MEIESSRFGRVEIDADTVVEFPDGLIGLGGRRYALVSTDPGSPFLWLQSLDDPAVALPVTNPHRFFPDFQVELSDDDAERLGIGPEASADVYVTVRATDRPEDVTVNTRAPILIHDGRAHQVINQAPGSELRARLLPHTASEGA
jgi:flagellar assembly factor FliW